MNKFAKINKRYHDIDDLYIGMIAPVEKTGKTPSDIKYSLNEEEMTYIIGYKDSKVLLDLISEQEYPIISKHYYDYVNKNSDIYFASGELKKLRIYIEQELDKNKLKIELNGKKKDLISLEDIRKIYNEINEIDKTNEVKKDENEISIGDYHYIALLKEIAKTSKKIDSSMKQKTKETFILQLVKLGEEYLEYIETNQLPGNYSTEIEYRNNIIERLADIETKINEANARANLEKNCKNIVKSIEPKNDKRR